MLNVDCKLRIAFNVAEKWKMRFSIKEIVKMILGDILGAECRDRKYTYLFYYLIGSIRGEGYTSHFVSLHIGN